MSALKTSLHRVPRILSSLLVLMLVIVAVFLPFSSLSSPFFFRWVSTDSSAHKRSDQDHGCDIYQGEWVPDPDSPSYTNTDCRLIQDLQNCMGHGRPDSEFLKWWWKPDACELPAFDPTEFFGLVSGKSMAFVGDSLARNQMQSLLCLLSRREYPTDISEGHTGTRWYFATHNFTVQHFWSAFLVKTKEVDIHASIFAGMFSLYLDEADERWSTKVNAFDYVVFSGGHWFSRSLYYYQSGELVGCHRCPDKNITHLHSIHGYTHAFRTAFRFMNEMKEFDGVTYLRTISPHHFEGGEWNAGGNCVRTRPFKRNETVLDGFEIDLYTAQVNELRSAEMEGNTRGLKFRLLDITRPMLLRPDGHPGSYGRLPKENGKRYNDCVHWCLPGPVDSWNAFMLELMKMDVMRGSI